MFNMGYGSLVQDRIDHNPKVAINKSEIQNRNFHKAMKKLLSEKVVRKTLAWYGTQYVHPQHIITPGQV